MVSSLLSKGFPYHHWFNMRSMWQYAFMVHPVFSYTDKNNDGKPVFVQIEDHSSSYECRDRITLRNLNVSCCRKYWNYVEGSRDRCVAWGTEDQPQGCAKYRTGIIGRVQNEGDAALRDFAKKYCELGDIAVSEDEREAAYDLVDTKVVESLIEAEARIERFHERQRPRDLWLEEMDPGIVLGVKTTALNRVGIYVPVGRAVYPSSTLMCAVPPRVAGVHEICACSPPPIKPLTLVALDIAGVTEIYNAGGAQAIAAMALGTTSARSRKLSPGTSMSPSRR